MKGTTSKSRAASAPLEGQLGPQEFQGDRVTLRDIFRAEHLNLNSWQFHPDRFLSVRSYNKIQALTQKSTNDLLYFSDTPEGSE